MSDSPIEAFLRAVDDLDLTAVMSLFGPKATVTMAFGDDATGGEQVREELGRFLAGLRATQHQVSSEWNPEPGVWIAELSATYELTDFSRRGPYMRAIFVRAGGEGIEQLTIYGAHELPLSENGRTYTNIRGPHGWLPTL